SWPELRSGPVSSRPVFHKCYDDHLLNRTLQAGETAPMDLGFSSEFYKGDVGRTLPVSGHFTPDQREVIDFMNSAYQSGLKAVHDGVSGDEIIQTCIRYVENHKDGLHSDLAKRAAAELLKPTRWVMYTHGLDMGGDITHQRSCTSVIQWRSDPISMSMDRVSTKRTSPSSQRTDTSSSI